MVTGVTIINSDSGCCRATDPDMALGNSPDPDHSMATGDSAGHTGQHDPSGGTTLGHQQGVEA